MYQHPGEWSHLGEARRIGAILGEMREIAALRAKAAGGGGRKLALRGNSA
ncbi:hypothetical protein FHS95_001294 [Sphingomonas naasensis]|nr:hypothetical protein [Sphingomonas naasensis]NIJ19625.1 hypothetical protein [Sphingomonas naasensis]